MRKIIFATQNKGKIKEVSHLLSSSGIQLISLLDFDDVPNIIENGKTFEENAKIKAKIIFDKYKIPTMSDDSGLSVDQLDGSPGVFSARYAGENATDEENNDKLLCDLKGFPEPHLAKFICSAVYYNGINFITSNGEVKGKLISSPRGKNGFGYDPLFIPNGYNVTSAELDMNEKNKISHRAIAFKKLINLIQTTENI
ncbi:MAG: RdgB/HAM1 family non-canonical purine NTP pyrophosphatase [Bacteroidetes bacterium]|nr:RdgB/HAM1 family non-canonical purine NTP pyrophosphatase [Bacteroidota bacterium]